MLKQFYLEIREKDMVAIVQQTLRLTTKLAPLEKVLHDVDFIDSLFHMDEENFKDTVNEDDIVRCISFSNVWYFVP